MRLVLIPVGIGENDRTRTANADGDIDTARSVRWSDRYDLVSASRYDTGERVAELHRGRARRPRTTMWVVQRNASDMHEIAARRDTGRRKDGRHCRLRKENGG